MKMELNIEATKEDMIDDLVFAKKIIDKAKVLLTEKNLNVSSVKKEIMRAKRVINFQLRKLDQISEALMN